MWECKNLEKRSNFLFQLLKYKILLLNTEWTYGPFILGKLKKKKDSQRFLKKKKHVIVRRILMFAIFFVSKIYINLKNK